MSALPELPKITAVDQSGWDWARAKTHALVVFVAGFVREHAPESSTRLCMLMLCSTGCYCAVRIMDFASANPKEHFTITAMVGVLTVLVASGCVSLALRTRSADSAAAQTIQNAAAAVLPGASDLPKPE